MRNWTHTLLFTTQQGLCPVDDLPVFCLVVERQLLGFLHNDTLTVSHFKLKAHLDHYGASHIVICQVKPNHIDSDFISCRRPLFNNEHVGLAIKLKPLSLITNRCLHLHAVSFDISCLTQWIGKRLADIDALVS